MGAPKIKIYQLPRGYSESGDNDIRESINDELLPVIDKPLLPEDSYLLTGVAVVEEDTGINIDFSVGKISSLLYDDNQQFQRPEGSPSNILSDGCYSPIVYNSLSEIISSSTYQATPSGILFAGIPPSGAFIEYYKTGENTNFVFTNKDWYDGINPSFKHYITEDDVIVDKEDYNFIAPSGVIIFNEDNPDRGVIKSYYSYLKSESNLFISEHENWVPQNIEGGSSGHLYMAPDVFVGEKDYSGDDTEDGSGNLIIQGSIPQFVESGYQIDFRKGSIYFSEEIDSVENPVRASYSHISCVENVTNQQLSLISSDGVFKYKCINDPRHPGSINSRWVNKDTIYIPINIYNDGELCPQTVTVNPYDTLTIKTEA
ncbi:MAG: hypothetical protein M0P71_01345 [Melioribacteraceae bacterium]|nr:hypothetical protein [Melioribacteraceae bacterium]